MSRFYFALSYHKRVVWLNRELYLLFALVLAQISLFAQVPTIVTSFANAPTTTSQLVKNTLVGANGIDPRWLTKIGNMLYFQATSSIDGDGLWKSDGTSTGTIQVKKTLGNSIYELKEMGGLLYFVLSETSTGAELWRSNGTTAGTYRVKDINLGTIGSMPNGLTVIGTTLYFVADNGTNGAELWQSDGTEGGTRMLRDIRVGGHGSDPCKLTVMNGMLYFVADDGSGMELWRSDGTPGGTVRVRDIFPGIESSNPRDLTAVGTTLYFSADNGVNGSELWKSDGSEYGTIMIKDIRPGTSGSTPRSFIIYNNLLYFVADDGEHGSELWQSNGIPEGTILIKDIEPGNVGSSPSSFSVSNSFLYFVANTSKAGDELWRTNGTEIGTDIFKDINTNITSNNMPASGVPGHFLNINDVLFFTANDGTTGEELWCTDGRIEGTVLIKDIMPNTAPSNTRELVEMGGSLYFIAADPFKGEALWRIDPCTLTAKIPKKAVNACSGSMVSIEGKSSSCLGIAYRWTSKPAGITSNTSTLSFVAPNVSQNTTYTFYFSVSYGNNSSKDSIQVVIKPQARFNVRVLLEGPYQAKTGLMSTTLNEAGILPGQKPVNPWNTVTAAGHPFNDEPWYYAGKEIVYDYPANIVDWVFVTLRTNPENVASTVYKKAMLLQKDGYLAPVGCLTMPPDGSYYLGLDHRNHLGVLSLQPISVINSSIQYDFTKTQSYISGLGFGYGQKKNGSLYMMYAGDFDKSLPTQIDAKDLAIWSNETGKFSEYLRADANFDGEVNKLDKEIHARNNGISSTIQF